jgi:hypothetical protein
MTEEAGEEVITGGSGGSCDQMIMAKTIAMCITVSNGGLSGGRRGRGFRYQIGHLRSPIATTIKRERSESGPDG